MPNIRLRFWAAWRDRSGATAIEYALIAILVSTMTTIGTWETGTFSGFANSP